MNNDIEKIIKIIKGQLLQIRTLSRAEYKEAAEVVEIITTTQNISAELDQIEAYVKLLENRLVHSETERFR